MLKINVVKQVVISCSSHLKGGIGFLCQQKIPVRQAVRCGPPRDSESEIGSGEPFKYRLISVGGGGSFLGYFCFKARVR